MNVSEAEALLGKLAASTRQAHAEVGRGGKPPHDYAYVKLTSRSDPALYAVVSTPGIRWFELEVAGGYNTGRADDLATDEEVREYVKEYLRVARAYLDGHWSIGRSRLLKLPFLTVHAENGAVKLGLSVRDEFRQIFKSSAVPGGPPVDLV